MDAVNGYVSRHFMTAISRRDQTGFIREAILYTAVLAGLTGWQSFTVSPRSGLGCFGGCG
jgi:hypothetical protein